MLELDCHITRDGEVVVSHDNSLLRVCNTKALITDTDYQVISLALRLYYMKLGLEKSSVLPVLDRFLKVKTVLFLD